MMNKKDICDLTALFGVLAVGFQTFNIIDLFQMSQNIEGGYWTESGYVSSGSNVMLLLIHQVILLLFYVFIAIMAYKLRES